MTTIISLLLFLLLLILIITHTHACACLIAERDGNLQSDEETARQTENDSPREGLSARESGRRRANILGLMYCVYDDHSAKTH